MSAPLCDLYHQTLDHISCILTSADTELGPVERSRTLDLKKKLDCALTLGEPVPAEKARGERISQSHPDGVDVVSHRYEEDHQVAGETVRIRTNKLDPLLRQAEELILAGIAAEQRSAEIREINDELFVWKKESALFRDHAMTESAPLWKEQFDKNYDRLRDLQSRVAEITLAAQQDHRALRRMLDEHLDDMKKILMLPVASLVESFPKFIRDLAREQGKEVDLVIQGVEIEIDKRILEEMKDPIIHLIRNSMDHGIEKPEERIHKNKPGRGKISLIFSAKDSRQVEIIVSDDGAGIDIALVRSAALKSGAISQEKLDKLDARETLSLIFQSGISTSRIITDLSGRGLGLAIVHDKVEKLGGVVSVDSQIHESTRFRILLPMTLATFRGLPVRAEDRMFVLPAVNVERVARVRRQEIRTIENRKTIELDGKILAIVRLSDALGLRIKKKISAFDEKAGADLIHAVILSSANKRIALEVDEVFGEQQVLVKGLGPQLSWVRNIAGAVILGKGEVVPVLNAGDVMKSAAQLTAEGRNDAGEPETVANTGRILVAEDSITSRTLLKSILESVGYKVATAVDGMDALTQARTGEFDLIVSDVDMPRMSGFELTARIRDNKKLAELPVVLVTALESREDRERGIDAGANAYIVKSSFDQSNLLEVVKRLI